MSCVVPVASSSRRRALRNRSKRRRERTDLCTIPVSSCMGVVHSEPTCIFIHELLYRVSRKSTSGTHSPLTAAHHIYRQMYFVHLYSIHVYCTLVNLDSSGPPGVSSRLLGSQPSTPSVLCVCACVYKHIHPHTLPPALKIEKTQTKPLSFLLSKKTPRQSISAFID